MVVKSSTGLILWVHDASTITDAETIANNSSNLYLLAGRVKVAPKIAGIDYTFLIKAHQENV